MTYNLVFGIHIPKTGITSIANTYTRLHPKTTETEGQYKIDNNTVLSNGNIPEDVVIVCSHPVQKSPFKYSNEPLSDIRHGFTYNDIYKYSPYIFTFFRNPYQRAISLYAHVLEYGTKVYPIRRGRSITSRYKDFFEVTSFKEVINCLETKVNYIGFYENYYKNVEKLFSNVGIPYDIIYLYHSMKTKKEYKKQGKLQCSEEEFICIYKEDYALYNYFWEKNEN